MMNRWRCLIIPTLLCCLNSCLRTDIGNTIGSIGKEVPMAVPSHGSYDCTAGVYARNGHYYITLPIAYVPEARCGIEYVPQLIGEPVVEIYGGDSDGRKTLNEVYKRTELQQFPAHLYYVVIAQEYAETERYSAPSRRGTCGRITMRKPQTVRLVEAEDFTPDKAEFLGLFDFDQAVCIAAGLPSRRAWYNYPLIPVQYAAMLGLDVPLSLITMPLSLPYVLVEPMIYNTDVSCPENP